MSNIHIHYHPILCHPNKTFGFKDIITCSTNIEGVTCPKCVYFYYHPEAKVLEDAYQAGRL